MSQEKIKLEVDGQELEATPGQMLIEVTDAADIFIPRFCYHRKLSVAANCRMCLVQVEKAPKPLPACATPVAPGMVVQTKSQYAIDAQQATMEFLLINHPLDCPICDQGGECELQDVAMAYGRNVSRYNEGKRVVKDKDFGPLVSTDMTRCIQCTRCVRFGEEIAGIQELGCMGRGDTMEISAFVEQSVNHELSGNIIDLCPVGALNNKPYRFSARAWEMEQRATIAPHDCLGSNLYAHTLRGRLKRIVPKDNDAINEAWLSDRDRFSYEGIYNGRIEQPMVRVDGKLVPATWEDALEKAAAGLNQLGMSDGGDSLGAWVSSSATVEEAYLTARIMRQLDSGNIDYRLRRRDFRGQEAESVMPGLGIALADVDVLNGLLIVGSNLRKEVPLLAHRVRKAALAGGQISFINAGEYEYLFPVANALVNEGADFVAELAAVVEAAGGTVDFAVANSIAVGSKQAAIVESLKSENASIFLGHMAQRHPAYARIYQLAAQLMDLTGARLGIISEGANSAGVAYAGALPHRGPAGGGVEITGADLGQMLASPVKGLLLMNVEPEFDCVDDVAALNALHDAEFVVVLSPWLTDSAAEHADVILPIGSFAETSGTFVNVEGVWQSFRGVAKPVGEARPAWKVLRVLGNLLKAPDFEYQSSEEVRDELRALAFDDKPLKVTELEEAAVAAVTPADLEVPVYSVDALVRRAESLQSTHDSAPGWRKTV
ncbi:MAG: NADH-quinone oxidoreductase subunit G [Gammaproteobacteria bacterium]|nr:NADH-quinone oxidoreductase subunit G [Gammaproteobacteria bacterium]MCP4090014.1 NADH-quinone oxidoreductase subunit G [Gammaproteobacteria bacterium]MCP4277766.1 NADH-quinone oxidoreductase subunit G [Gammaproteobacteria bacterium]MCP4831678.1 NADH-quinone oxidoreductase subunit G [Gammaproteobacteria bacterium]MCP4929296.1 NADH-quinone oxidoreductase subunit G [Gammaproteobacteria bacterium]